VNEHVDELTGQVRLLRDQVALDSRVSQARFKALEVEVSSLKVLLKAEKLQADERKHAATVLLRQAAADVQALCIERAAGWDHKSRLDRDIETFDDYYEHIASLAAEESAAAMSRFCGILQDLGIDDAALSALESIRKAGNQYARERLHKLPVDMMKGRLDRAAESFPVSVWSSVDEAIITLQKDVACTVAALYSMQRHARKCCHRHTYRN